MPHGVQPTGRLRPGRIMLVAAALLVCIAAAEEPATRPADTLSEQHQAALDQLITSLEKLRTADAPEETLLAWFTEESGQIQGELERLDDQIAALRGQLAEAEARTETLRRRLSNLDAGQKLVALARAEAGPTSAREPAPAVEPEAPAARPAEAPPEIETAAAQPPDAARPTSFDDPGVALFVEHIQPTFEVHCIDCHSGGFRKAGLDLTTREAILEGGDGGPAITPGNADESLLYKVIAHEQEPFMPHRQPKLPEETIAQIAAWINAGAPFDGTEAQADTGEQAGGPQVDHWSFRPTARPAPPEPRGGTWGRNPIDRFVLARLEQEGIKPSPEADRRTLIRRLYLDLLGLLPPPEEVDAFASDTSPDAYDRLVDDILSSPHFGERWGRHWLDLARYADSDGYEKDSVRPHAWRYRDWVIRAINEDLPFDQFTIDQLAGDLLPDATVEQRVATGFHRNTLTNREGGVDQEEFRTKAVVDRVGTTGSVWLGMTVSCAECHTHKYDPITQREFFGLYAFFNNADERDIPAPLPEQFDRYEEERRSYRVARAKLTEERDTYIRDDLSARQAAWEADQRGRLSEWLTLEPLMTTSANGATLTVREDHAVLAGGERPATDTYTIAAYTTATGITGFELEVLPDASLPNRGPGRSNRGNLVLNALRVTAAPAADPAATVPVELTRAVATHSQDRWSVAGAIDGDPQTGWAIMPHHGKPQQAVFEAAGPIGFDGGTILVFTLEQNYGEQHTIGGLRLALTTAKGPLNPSPLPGAVAAALETDSDQRTDEQRRAIADHYRSVDEGLARLNQAIEANEATNPERWAPKAQTLVERRENRRATHVHLRGDFLSKGPQVEPHTPAVLPPMYRLASDEPPTRVDLARWLVSPDNPLTARVTVNRYWQYLFGTGLVETTDDFGLRGTPPSHPDLLDWLAAEFMDRGWSRKEMIRLIVTSATYRQSSHARPDLHESDPRNLLLAQQNRYRPGAEIVRDINLHASGLLHTAVGGPSVRPPMPEGIADLGYAYSVRWNTSDAPDRYRRGLYIHFQRTVPYPMLMTFDAPDGNVTCVRRERSNTPLQSLTLLNDPVFVECAQHLAGRMLTECSGGVDDRIAWAFRTTLGRLPDDFERERLAALYRDMLDMTRADADAAAQLAGEAAGNGADPAETAAWVTVARTILNLDEFLTRE